MKKLILIALLVPSLAFATWNFVSGTTQGNQSVQETQGTTSPVTRTAPTIAGDGALAGISLANPQLPAGQSGQHGLTVTVCSATGTTLSGGGQIKFYGYDAATPEWAEIPDLVVSVTSTARCQTFLGLNIVNARGRLMAVASGVTFSAGSAGVTVYMLVR